MTSEITQSQSIHAYTVYISLRKLEGAVDQTHTHVHSPLPCQLVRLDILTCILPYYKLWLIHWLALYTVYSPSPCHYLLKKSKQPICISPRLVDMCKQFLLVQFILFLHQNQHNASKLHTLPIVSTKHSISISIHYILQFLCSLFPVGSPEELQAAPQNVGYWPLKAVLS